MTTTKMGIKQEDIDRFLKGSKQELSMGNLLTEGNLSEFIDSSLVGTTVSELVDYYESKLKEKDITLEKQREKLIETIEEEVDEWVDLHGGLADRTSHTFNASDLIANLTPHKDEN